MNPTPQPSPPSPRRPEPASRRRSTGTGPAGSAPPSARLFKAPCSQSDRITLFAIRAMATGGLADARAASTLLNAFGLHFRRPLILLRAVMVELTSGTARRIAVAPGCCQRLTGDEARLLAALRHAPANEVRARRRLAALTGRRENPRLLCVSAAYGWALRDLGRPLGN